MLKFSDGVSIDTSGELRKLTLSDGIYVVGNGMLVPVDTNKDAEELIEKLGGTVEKKDSSSIDI